MQNRPRAGTAGHGLLQAHRMLRRARRGASRERVLPTVHRAARLIA
jgi:hypothetical protein